MLCGKCDYALETCQRTIKPGDGSLKIRIYKVGHKPQGLRIVLLSDFHNNPYEPIISQVKEQAPDMIAIAGDMTYGYGQYDKVRKFLAYCGKIAPTYFSLGNHDSREIIGGMHTGKAVLLDDEYRDIVISGRNIRIGGLSSPASRYVRKDEHEEKSHPTKQHDKQNEYGSTEVGPAKTLSGKQGEETPNVSWLDSFCNTPNYKILLCHQPEYYSQYLQNLPIDVILSGHTHGGQWRIGNQGVYAHGQGLFPKLSGGVYFEKLVISRGLSNTTWIPRFFNPREIVLVEV